MTWSTRLTLLACMLSMMAGVSLAQACGDALKTHNMYRARHGAGADLRWDNSLVAQAQAKATELANAGCRSLSASIMQNVWGCLGNGCGSCSQATDTWYDGGANMYKFTAKPWTDNQANFYKGVGGFTQVVWRGAKNIGCALARGPGGCGVVVCQYDAGNMIGDSSFKANVWPLSTTTTTTPPTTDNTNGNGNTNGNSNTNGNQGTTTAAGRANALAVHNKYRSQHGAADLKWNDLLVQTSQKKAKALADKGCRALSVDLNQNAWACYGKGCGSCSAATDSWYKGGATSYKFTAKPWTDNRAQFQKIGGFTQLVWRGAQSVGCAQVSGKDCAVVICTYDAGNLSTDKAFKDNVQRKGTKVTTPKVPSANDDKLEWCAEWAKEGMCDWSYEDQLVSKWCPTSCPTTQPTMVARRMMRGVTQESGPYTTMYASSEEEPATVVF